MFDEDEDAGSTLLTSSEPLPVRCGVCNQQHMAVQISKAPAESTEEEEEEEEDGRLY